MAHLTIRDWLLFVAAVLLGAAGGIWHLYFLVPVSLVILYIALSTSEKFRRHEMTFLFPLSFFSCLPFNLRMAEAVAGILTFSSVFSLATLFYYLGSLLVLICVEELILGIIGMVMWGDQTTVYYKDLFIGPTVISGNYLKQTTKEELLRK